MREIVLPLDRPPLIRSIDYCVAATPFVHQDRVLDYHVLLYVDHGEISLWEEGEAFAIRAGEVFFLKAGCHHWGTEEVAASTRWFYIHFSLEEPEGDAEPFVPYAGFLRNQEFSRQEYRRTATLPKRARIPETMDIRSRLRELHNLYCSADPYRPLRLSAGMTALLADLCETGPMHAVSSKPDVAVRRLIAHLEKNRTAPLDAEQIANYMYMNYRYLCGIFKQRTGMSIRQYHTRLRIAESARLLRETTSNISQAAASVGFSDPLYFSAVFKKVQGMSPSEYLKRSYRRE